MGGVLRAAILSRCMAKSEHVSVTQNRLELLRLALSAHMSWNRAVGLIASMITLRRNFKFVSVTACAAQ